MGRLRILLAGLAAPFVARLIYAVPRGEVGRWMEQWGRWMTDRPRDVATIWIWFLLPFGVLALGASWATERRGRWAVRLGSV